MNQAPRWTLTARAVVLTHWVLMGERPATHLARVRTFPATAWNVHSFCFGAGFSG